MNRHFILFAIVFAAALSGVAKTFDVDISTGRPAASNEAYYHGETIEFRAVRGRSAVTNIEYAAIYYQTNGMGDVWWKTDGLCFHPTNDVGAASYRFFLEGRDDLGRDWHANGLLRLLPSPGFEPNEIELPVARLDFANIEVANAPYYSKAETESKIVELAPAPGDYAAVSNAAMNAVQTEADPVWNAEKSDYATIQALEEGDIVPDRANKANYANLAGLASNAAELGDRSATVILTQLDDQTAQIATLTNTTSTLNDSISTLDATKADRSELADDIADISARIDAAGGPQRYVVSPLPNYYYTGSVSIPVGNYYKAVAGEGYSRYAARIPVPSGAVTLVGENDDPIISYFGSEIAIDASKLTITSLSSRESEGQYNIADLVYLPDTALGLTASFHCNILNPASELSSIGFTTSPGSMTFTIGDEQHTCTVTSQSSSGFSYTDEIYNLSDGNWTSVNRNISVAFEPSSDTGWGYGVFGGAELAVKGDPGTVRVLGLRTGLPGEYGSGWGYKTYNFSSDRRNWEINVPNLQASCNKSSATTTKYFVTTGGAVTNDFQCYVSPLSQSEHCITIATLEETADAYGEDACAQVTWRVSMFPTITNRTDACALSVIATNRVQVGIIGVNETQESVVPASFTVIYHGQKWTSSGYHSYTATHTISNFRITAITGSGATRTISFSYDVAAVVGYIGRTYYAYYTASQIVTLTSGLDIDSTVTKPSTLIVTDRNQHLFYDEGLMCTWELCVTNGIFFTRKVSNGDFRKEDE